MEQCNLIQINWTYRGKSNSRLFLPKHLMVTTTRCSSSIIFRVPELDTWSKLIRVKHFRIAQNSVTSEKKLNLYLHGTSITQQQSDKQLVLLLNNWNYSSCSKQKHINEPLIKYYISIFKYSLFLNIRCFSLFPDSHVSRYTLVCMFTHFCPHLVNMWSS